MGRSVSHPEKLITRRWAWHPPTDVRGVHAAATKAGACVLVLVGCVADSSAGYDGFSGDDSESGASSASTDEAESGHEGAKFDVSPPLDMGEGESICKVPDDDGMDAILPE